MIRALAAVGCALAIARGASVSAQAPSEEPPSGMPPSIVLVVADDLGVGDIGPYGQAQIETPSLDALAARGARFTAAYAASPLCAPSRCALMTGLTAIHCAVRDNARPNVPIGREAPLLPFVLGATGYHTGLVGKWGLGGQMDEGTSFAIFSRPTALGFDRFVGLLDQEIAEVAFPYEWFDGELPVRNGSEGEPRRWIATVLIEEALAFVAEAPRDAQYLLVFTPTLPHREHRVPAIDPRYVSRGWPEIEATYATMVTELDTEVGRLVEAVAARGETERTLILFTSDNGPNTIDGHDAAFFDSTAGLRGQKRDLYEGGVRVPLIVAGPGIAPASIAAPVALYDVMPTLAELAGAPALGLDGVSLVPLLRGATPDADERAVVMAVSDELGRSHALRSGPWSLVRHSEGRHELFDLIADPAQTTDRSAERPEIVDRLSATLDELVAPREGRSTARLIAGEDDALAEPPSSIGWVASFDFDADGGSSDPLASDLRAPPLRAMLNGGAGLNDGALRLPRAGSGAARAHAVIAAEPAFGMGESSFTFAAQVRLDGGEVEGRATVACARPAGREERFTDWAVLARVGPRPLALDEAMPADDGPPSDPSPWAAGNVGVVFGDPTISGRGRRGAERALTIPLVSSLHIDDDAWHTLVVRYDAAHAQVTFALDGIEDVVPVPERAPYPSDGPLVLGACLGVSGEPEGALIGALDDVVLARGDVVLARGDAVLARGDAMLARGDAVLARGDAMLERGDAGRSIDVAPPPIEPRVIDVDLGDIETATAITRTIPLSGDGRPLRLALDVRALDPERVEARLDRELVLAGGRAELTITVRDRPGALVDQILEIRATDALWGTLAEGAPIRVRVTGTVRRPPSRAGWIEGGAIALVLAVIAVVIAWRARRAR